MNAKLAHVVGSKLGLQKKANLPPYLDPDVLGPGALVGGLGGAGLGALSGILSPEGKKESTKERIKTILRRAMYGGLAGGALGMAGGGLLGQHMASLSGKELPVPEDKSTGLSEV
jgi:hypothetical protein